MEPFLEHHGEMNGVGDAELRVDFFQHFQDVGVDILVVFGTDEVAIASVAAAVSS